MFQIVSEALSHQGAIHEILEDGFGVNRLKKTVYRLRAAAAPVADLSLVAVEDVTDDVLGTLRFWPIEVRHADGSASEALLLGPLAVAAHTQGQGVGKALVTAALEKIDLEYGLPVMLVGPLSYYAPFGFSTVHVGEITLPGAFDPARLQLRCVNGQSLAGGVVAAGHSGKVEFARSA